MRPRARYRCSHASYSGPTKPSISRKSQTNAATLINKRHRDEEAGDEAAPEPLHRRSYNQRAAIAAKSASPSDDPIPGERREAGRRTNGEKRPHDEADAMNAMTKPTAISDRAIDAELMPDLQQTRARRPPSSSASPGRTRTPPPRRDPARSACRRRSSRPIATRRESARASGTTPMPSARPSGVRSASRRRRRPEPLHEQHHDAADDEASRQLPSGSRTGRVFT